MKAEDLTMATLTLQALPARHPATRPLPNDAKIRLVGGMSREEKNKLWTARAKRKARKRRATKSRKVNRQRGK